MVKALGSGVVPCGVTCRGRWVPEAPSSPPVQPTWEGERDPETAHENRQGKKAEKPMVGLKA